MTTGPTGKCAGEDLVLRCLAPERRRGVGRSSKYYFCGVKEMTGGTQCGSAIIDPKKGSISFRAIGKRRPR